MADPQGVVAALHALGKLKPKLPREVAEMLTPDERALALRAMRDYGRRCAEVAASVAAAHGVAPAAKNCPGCGRESGPPCNGCFFFAADGVPVTKGGSDVPQP